ncbi:MAG: prolipoprotein diacylglyceryl transferase [Chlamydiia bacterium]|nr:prolipoprotein diacylglyceryl transferase [Chlamydiia bacterium]
MSIAPLQNVFVWDPSPNIFTVPVINHPITWYGVLFAFGFFVAYFVVRHLFFEQLKNDCPNKPQTWVKRLSVNLTDRLTLLVIIGTLIGARLGHVFFYGWTYYVSHPVDILKIWEGGLASHGGAVGILLAIGIFTFQHKKNHSSFTFLATLDAIVVPAAFVGGCIRIGNFINQEILGTPTLLPWGVIFLRPVQGMRGVPLHPVQLYESLFYFISFVLLIIIWKKLGQRIGGGILAGWFFILIFSFRFLIEYIKLPQSELLKEDSWLNMGQMLSLPLILLGIVLVATYSMRQRRRNV